MKKLLITIDGPAGAGKTTVSRALADRLQYKYIDTGALYRAVAYEAMSRGIEPDDDDGLEQLCSRIQLKFLRTDKGLRLFSNGVDITDHIRTPQVTMLASAVSARAVVREFLLEVQREMGREKGLVFEGRDMGTVVFPDADMKFYLDAAAKTRASRRYEELKSRATLTIDEVEQDMQQRDKNDSTRTLAPLKAASDAIIIDSTDMAINEVVEHMLAYIGKYE